MKKIITIFSAITILAVVNVFAQTPQAFKYQAIARDISGNILMNHNVSFRISILQGSVSGTNVYTETQTATTNQFGLANLNIGNGTLVSGNFSTISWGTNTYFVKMEFDAAGGSTYVLMGTSQLLSVPYSLYSINAGNSLSDHDTSATNELQTLSQVGANVTLSNGGGTISVADGDTALWKKNGSDIYYNSGKIGIGTTSPINDPVGSKLDIRGYAHIIENSDTYVGLLWSRSGGPTSGWNSPGGTWAITRYPSSLGDFLSIGVAGTSEILTLRQTGNIGIGTTNPKSQLHVFNGDINIEAIGSGIIIKSPNGNCWRVTIDNSGNLIRTAITCP